MRIVFRTDASSTIGSGHVMRCLTLANALRLKNASVSFICREFEGHLCDLIMESGYSVVRLPAPTERDEERNTSISTDWLGISWQDDAEKTRAIIEYNGVIPDWLVVDHYGIDQRWERVLRPFFDRLLVIDDLADRFHDCDILLDQNLVAHMQARYVDKVPAACGFLLGPEYALLQPTYANLRKRIPPREGKVERIFIYFGGADTNNMTGRALAAFLSLGRLDIEVDVVIAASSIYAEAIRQQVAGHKNINLHSNLPTLASLMVKADLAIGAAGATSWERLCLGLPSLVVSLAENQRPIADELNQRGLVLWLGHRDEVGESNIAKALSKLLQQEHNNEFSLRCSSVIDGLGVSRVCASLTVTATTTLRVRHANLDDEALLLKWANDPTTRRNAFSPELISVATHQAWFHKNLRDLDGCHLYIVETLDGIPLGQVRFERSEHAWEIHYSIAPTFRGRGLGRPLLEASLQQLHADEGVSMIFGQVKSDNLPSRKIFESLGFVAKQSATSAIVEYRRMIWEQQFV